MKYNNYINKIKLALKLILDSFVKIDYNGKILYIDGDKLINGVSIYYMDENGELLPLNDGEYEINYNDNVVIITVKDGIVIDVKEKDIKQTDDVISENIENKSIDNKMEFNDENIKKIYDIFNEYDKKINEIIDILKKHDNILSNLPSTNSIEDKPSIYNDKNSEIEEIRKLIKK